MNNYCVYKHVCPNNKVYVGISKNPLRRWCDGLGYRYNDHFYSSSEAFKKYHIRNIDLVCKGLRKTAGGFHWRYV